MLRWFLILFLPLNATFAQSNEEILLLYKDSIHNNTHTKVDWYNQISFIHLTRKEYDSARKYLHLGLKPDLKKEPGQKAYIYNSLGISYSSFKIDSSIYFYTKAKEEYINLKDTANMLSTTNNLGKIYRNLGLYERALHNLTYAALISERQKDTLNLSSSYTTIASIHSRLKDFNEALRYHYLALNLSLAVNDTAKISSSYNNIGIAYKNLGQFDSTIVYYSKALQLEKVLQDHQGIGRVLNNLGTAYMHIKQYDSAISYLNDALEWRKKSNDTKGLAITLNNLGKWYALNHNNQKALDLLLTANKSLKELKLADDLIDNLENLFLTYESLGVYKSAITISKELISVKDSLLSQEKMEAVIESQIKYETDKKIYEISILEEQQRVQEAELKIKQSWIVSLVIITALVIAIALLIYTLWGKEKAAKRQVETLMQELHHRVKNNLQLLSSIFSLQSRAIHDANALEAVKSGENRVNAMAIIHKKLYRKTESRTVNLHEYVSELIEALAFSYGYHISLIKMKIDPINLDVDKVIPIGLIVNELVSNSFKYAFTKTENPELKIALKQEENTIILTVSDNGPGFDLEKVDSTSMGMNIITTLGQQLRGSVHWKTQGTTAFTLTIKQ